MFRRWDPRDFGRVDESRNRVLPVLKWNSWIGRGQVDDGCHLDWYRSEYDDDGEACVAIGRGPQHHDRASWPTCAEQLQHSPASRNRDSGSEMVNLFQNGRQNGRKGGDNG